MSKSLGAGGYGVWVQAALIVGILLPVVALGLDKAVLRLLPDITNRRERLANLFGMMLASVAVAVSVGLILVLTAELLPLGAAATPQLAAGVAAVLCASIVNLFATEGLRSALRLGAYTSTSIARDAGSLAVIATVVIAGGSIAMMLFAYALWLLAVGILAFGLLMRGIGWTMPQVRRLGPALRFGLPIFVLHPFAWLAKAGPMALLGVLGGTVALGIYAAARALADLVNLLPAVLLSGAIPRASHDHARGDVSGAGARLASALEAFIAAAAGIVVVLIAFPRDVLTILTTSEIAQGASVVLPMLLLAAVSFGVYSIASETVMLARSTHLFFYVTTATAALATAVALIAIPRWGLLGAALTELIAGSALMIWALLYARTSMRVTIAWRRLSRIAAAAIVVLLGLILLARLPGNFAWKGGAALVVYGGLLLALRVPLAVGVWKLAREGYLQIRPRRLAQRDDARGSIKRDRSK